MSTEVKVPTLGESVAEATIGEWLKQPGEPVALDEPIASLETDKVAVEVPSPVAGVMGQHLAKVGDNVSVGAVIATVESGAGAAAPAAAPASSPSASLAPAAPAAAAEPSAASERIWCAAGGSSEFKQDCTVERSSENGRAVVVIRHDDGKFRRLLASEDGQTLLAADGADQSQSARKAAPEGERWEVILGDDRYIVPVKADAPRP